MDKFDSKNTIENYRLRFSVITNFEVFRKRAQSEPCDEPVLLSPEITANL